MLQYAVVTRPYARLGNRSSAYRSVGAPASRAVFAAVGSGFGTFVDGGPNNQDLLNDLVRPQQQ